MKAIDRIEKALRISKVLYQRNTIKIKGFSQPFHQLIFNNNKMLFYPSGDYIPERGLEHIKVLSGGLKYSPHLTKKGSEYI